MSGRARCAVWARAGGLRPAGGAVGRQVRPARRGPVGARTAGATGAAEATGVAGATRAAAVGRARPAARLGGSASGTGAPPDGAPHAHPATTVGGRGAAR